MDLKRCRGGWRPHRFVFGSSGNRGCVSVCIGGGGKADIGGSGMVAGAKDGLAAGVGVGGFNAVGMIEPGSSAGRIVPKVETVRCVFDLGEAADVLAAGGESGSFTPVGRIGSESSAGRIVPKVEVAWCVFGCAGGATVLPVGGTEAGAGAGA